MFTNNKTSYYGNDKVLIEAACLSTDSKPTTGIANGSACIEMDTGKTFMFNEEDSEWEELPDSSGSGGGGSGGSSDFSTAEVTLVNNTSSQIQVEGIIHIATFMGEEGMVCEDVQVAANNVRIIKMVLFKGWQGFSAPDAVSVTTSGSATNDEGWLTVTGDCTITMSSPK